MIGDALSEIRVTMPDLTPTPDAKLERLLDLADDVQAVFDGSFVEIIVHAPDAKYRDRDLTDNPRLYSLRIKARAS